MAEEKTISVTKRPARAQVAPDLADEKVAVNSLVEAPPSEYVQVSEEPSVFSALRAFIAYRRAEIYRPRLGGVIGGAAAMNAAQSESVLKELEKFADWLDAGQPKPGQILSEVDKDFYRAAVARGLPVPEEITRQL